MSNLECPHCGSQVEEQRINAITLNGRYPDRAKQGLTCISCMHDHDVDRKAGVMPTDHKMMGSIVITDQRSAERYSNLSHRAGTGVSRGVKFHTGRR